MSWNGSVRFLAYITHTHAQASYGKMTVVIVSSAQVCCFFSHRLQANKKYRTYLLYHDIALSPENPATAH